jgi:hypothetical protein
MALSNGKNPEPSRPHFKTGDPRADKADPRLLSPQANLIEEEQAHYHLSVDQRSKN